MPSGWGTPRRSGPRERSGGRGTWPWNSLFAWLRLRALRSELQRRSRQPDGLFENAALAYLVGEYQHEARIEQLARGRGKALVGRDIGGVEGVRVLQVCGGDEPVRHATGSRPRARRVARSSVAASTSR